MATPTFPYISFAGNCEEAMEFYKSCLGGTLNIMRYDDSPMEVTDDQKQKVMHSTLSFDGGKVMAADTVMGPAPAPGSNMSIMLAPEDGAFADQVFKALSAGGKITMPFDKTFWGAKFGMFVDKFGIHWMVNYEMNES